MTILRLAAPIALTLSLAACGSEDQGDPGGLTASEAQELNDAAAMLDANVIELNDVTPPENGQ